MCAAPLAPTAPEDGDEEDDIVLALGSLAALHDTVYPEVQNALMVNESCCLRLSCVFFI